MDLVSQAYRQMLDDNKAKQAATLLNNGVVPVFHAGQKNYYEVNGSGETKTNSMAIMADQLAQNGFGHLHQDNDTNHFSHFESGKRIKVITVQKGDGFIHQISRYQ